MEENTGKPKPVCLKFGDFPGGVSLHEYSPPEYGMNRFSPENLSRIWNTPNITESNSTDLVGLGDGFNLHGDKNYYGFSEPFGHKAPVWNLKQGKLGLAASHPEENEVTKQLSSLVLLDHSPKNQTTKIIQANDVAYQDSHTNHRNVCTGETGFGSLKRYDSSHCSDEGPGATHSLCVKCASLSYTPVATLSDIRRNAELLEKERASFVFDDCQSHRVRCHGRNGGGCDSLNCHEYLGFQDCLKRDHCSHTCPMGNACPMSSHKIPTLIGMTGAYPDSVITPQKLPDTEGHSRCTHSDGHFHGGTHVAGHRHHRDAKHKHCGVRRLATTCGPFCREWHGEHIFPDDDPPPSHMMGKGKYNPLYKTEMCRNWSEMGHCRYGRTCQFAHGRSELRQAPRSNQWKTKTCLEWVNGTCSYGHRCCYAHPNTINMEPQAYRTSRFAGFFEGGVNKNE